MNIDETIFNIEEESKTPSEKVLRYAFIINHLINLRRNLHFEPSENVDIATVNDEILNMTHKHIHLLIEKYKFKLEQLVKNDK